VRPFRAGQSLREASSVVLKLVACVCGLPLIVSCVVGAGLGSWVFFLLGFSRWKIPPFCMGGPGSLPEACGTFQKLTTGVNPRVTVRRHPNLFFPKTTPVPLSDKDVGHCAFFFSLFRGSLVHGGTRCQIFLVPEPPVRPFSDSHGKWGPNPQIPYHLVGHCPPFILPPEQLSPPRGPPWFDFLF